jgi:hypothetical protein
VFAPSVQGEHQVRPLGKHSLIWIRLAIADGKITTFPAPARSGPVNIMRKKWRQGQTFLQTGPKADRKAGRDAPAPVKQNFINFFLDKEISFFYANVKWSYQ